MKKLSRAKWIKLLKQKDDVKEKNYKNFDDDYSKYMKDCQDKGIYPINYRPFYTHCFNRLSKEQKNKILGGLKKGGMMKDIAKEFGVSTDFLLEIYIKSFKNIKVVRESF